MRNERSLFVVGSERIVVKLEAIADLVRQAGFS